MSITTTLLRPAAYLAGLHAGRQLQRFLRAHERTAEIQQSLLRELTAAHAATAFGRDHGLGKVATFADFRAAVPVCGYERLRPYMDRVLAGDVAALLPAGERVMMFSMTSGTTGKPKFIPVTQRFLQTIRQGWNTWGVRALSDHPRAWLRPILQIASSMNETASPTGIPCGAISGLLAATQKRIVRRMYAVPLGVADIKDSVARYYTVLRCGVGRDVSIITTANPSSTIKLIEIGRQHCDRLLRDVHDGTLTPPGDGAGDLARRLRFKPNAALARSIEQQVQRDGQLLPRHFWKIELLANWTGGTLHLYLRRLRELFGDVPIRDIGLLASEGRFSVPIADGSPAGVADILSNVLEFIPAEEAGRENPATLLAHEVEVGHEYSLVVTNWASLWRYDMDDRVRVVSRLGQSPVFEFLSRGRHTANITGEKITEHQVVSAMRQAAAAASCPIERFVLQGRFAATPYYELRLELPAQEKADQLAQCLDASLADLNIEYDSKRKSGRLGPIRALRLPPGTLEAAEAAAIRSRHGRSDQYKHQYLLTDVLSE